MSSLTLPGATAKPVTPSRTKSARPPIREATIGLPIDDASTATSPNGSAHFEGMTPMPQWRHADITWAWSTLCWTMTSSGHDEGESGCGVPRKTSGGLPSRKRLYASRSS